jgi:NodT family efflux transporter outer membrane factor (OMF) lipoprotein
VRTGALVCLAALLGGCAAVGPNYERPALEAPVQWAEGGEKAEAAPALEQVAWWKTFGDPVLNGLIEQAAKTNLDLEQARARVVQARSDLVVAGAAGLPSANATASVTRSDASDNLPVAVRTGPSTVYQAGFDASWEIDVFGGIRRSVEAAQARLQASVEDLRATLLTLLGDVARNYLDVRANQEQLAITRRNVEAQQETAAVTRERYRLGLTSYLDVAQAEAQKSATEANIPTFEAAIKQSIHRLGILLGREPNALKAELSAPSALPRLEGMIAVGLPSELLARRPDLRRAERQLAAASADIGVATAGLYPRFDLSLGLGLQADSTSKFSEISSRYWSVVPGVALPLFDGGKTRAIIEGRRAVYDESLARYRSAFLSALEDVENTLAAYSAEQARRRILADSVRSNEEAVTLANERYRRGLTTFLDVLTSENALFSAQRSLSQSDANLLTNLIALYKALGGGWGAADVRLARAEILLR